MTIANFIGVIGDGVHDDTEGIQAALDEGHSLVHLPSPPVHYVISKPLKIHSNQELRLDRFSLIRLAPQSDCLMITNDDHDNGNENIEVMGGIWDMDNVQQSPNPIMNMLDGQVPEYDPQRYLGICMRFVGVTHFTMRSLTFRDPVTFCTQFARMRYFTIDDITLDFQHWNPYPINMDGIHLDGHCRFGRITNIKGTAFDDVIALNADDSEGESPAFGPIEDITIDGIYAENCHSAVRILSCGSLVRRISISNVFGTYYQYVIGITKFYQKRPLPGDFDAITLSNIHCAKAPRYLHYQKDSCPVFPLIWCEKGTRIGTLTIDNLHRHEEHVPADTIGIEKDAEIDLLTVTNSSSVNYLEQPFQMVVNEGKIHRLIINNVTLTHAGQDSKVLQNTGQINSLVLDA